VCALCCVACVRFLCVSFRLSPAWGLSKRQNMKQISKLIFQHTRKRDKKGRKTKKCLCVWDVVCFFFFVFFREMVGVQVDLLPKKRGTQHFARGELQSAQAELQQEMECEEKGSYCFQGGKGKVSKGSARECFCKAGGHQVDCLESIVESIGSIASN